MSRTVPAEWSPHRALWVGFPSDGALWEDDLAPAQREVADLVRALAGPGGERVRLMTSGEEAAGAARALLADAPGVEITPGRFGDVWLRDTGPIFFSADAGAAFAFNGWGGKYRLAGDETVADQIAAAAGANLERQAFVLEGGALEHDGEGTLLTTRECLLNPNRNRGWTEAVANAALAESLSARKVVWLGNGLINDHTDGHVDNLARFVAPGVVATGMAHGADDPHASVYDAAAQTLSSAVDAAGRRLRVARVPSPGRVLDADHRIAPASHLNFIIANKAVVFPTYNARPAEFAKQALEALFPGRAVIGLPARALLTGGGAFHCISREEPA